MSLAAADAPQWAAQDRTLYVAAHVRQDGGSRVKGVAAGLPWLIPREARCLGASGSTEAAMHQARAALKWVKEFWFAVALKGRLAGQLNEDERMMASS